ncbi:MAG: hypothetical protein IKI65_02755 [Firmicutes bacterium]|nr:hypothetical protein [Bacillota bacterium]
MINKNTIYKFNLDTGVEIYAYVRAWKNGEIGYSVLEKATSHPDFSNSGVFWMRAEDFLSVFSEYKTIRSN